MSVWSGGGAMERLSDVILRRAGWVGLALALVTLVLGAAAARAGEPGPGAIRGQSARMGGSVTLGLG